MLPLAVNFDSFTLNTAIAVNEKALSGLLNVNESSMTMKEADKVNSDEQYDGAVLPYGRNFTS